MLFERFDWLSGHGICGIIVKYFSVELQIGTCLYPGIKDVVLWLNRVDVVAVVKVIDCYHDSRRCIKHLSKIEYLRR